MLMKNKFNNIHIVLVLIFQLVACSRGNTLPNDMPLTENNGNENVIVANNNINSVTDSNEYVIIRYESFRDIEELSLTGTFEIYNTGKTTFSDGSVMYGDKNYLNMMLELFNIFSDDLFSHENEMHLSEEFPAVLYFYDNIADVHKPIPINSNFQHWGHGLTMILRDLELFIDTKLENYAYP